MLKLIQHPDLICAVKEEIIHIDPASDVITNYCVLVE